MGLKSSWRALGYCQGCVPLGVLCHASVLTWLGGLPSLEAYMTPYAAIRTSPKGGDFQVRASLGPVGPVSEEHGCLQYGFTFRLWVTKDNSRSL